MFYVIDKEALDENIWLCILYSPSGRNALQMSRSLPDMVTTRRKKLERTLKRTDAKEKAESLLEYTELEAMELFITTGKDRKKPSDRGHQVYIFSC